MHADSSAARLGWPGRRAKASAGRRTVFPKCGAAFQGPGAFEGGRTKIERGRTRIEGGAQASKGGAAPRYFALANSLTPPFICRIEIIMYPPLYFKEARSKQKARETRRITKTRKTSVHDTL